MAVGFPNAKEVGSCAVAGRTAIYSMLLKRLALEAPAFCNMSNSNGVTLNRKLHSRFHVMFGDLLLFSLQALVKKKLRYVTKFV